MVHLNFVDLRRCKNLAELRQQDATMKDNNITHDLILVNRDLAKTILAMPELEAPAVEHPQDPKMVYFQIFGLRLATYAYVEESQLRLIDGKIYRRMI